ncbi:hypothetical protein KKB18_00430, partial [bacterium]|nr:hypothetical protein [bacterium]
MRTIFFIEIMSLSKGEGNMRNKCFMVLLIVGILVSSGSLFARDNEMEFGGGLLLGYYFPELSDHVGSNYYMESTNKAIYGLNLTFGVTP